MPQCVKCMNFLPPNYMVEITDENRKVKIKEDGSPALQCVFCEKEIEHVELILGKDRYEKYTKEQCIKDYFKFTKKMKESKDVRQILKASEEKRFKI